MKLKEKKILAIILTITICISSMINTSICGATPEDDGKEAVYAEDKNEIKEDYEKISFSHSFKIQSEWENHYTAEMILKNTGKMKLKVGKLHLNMMEKFKIYGMLKLFPTMIMYM